MGKMVNNQLAYCVDSKMHILFHILTNLSQTQLKMSW